MTWTSNAQQPIRLEDSTFNLTQLYAGVLKSISSAPRSRKALPLPIKSYVSDCWDA
jgi:hypothetical protein